MQPPSASYRDTYQLVTVVDAARILGVSDSTVRRLVKTGRLEAERAQRPQGHVWLVKVPAPVTEPSGTRHHLAAAAPAEPSTPPALAAWMTSVLEPLVTELAAGRERIESLARENGRLAAELEHLRASVAAQGAQDATQEGRRAAHGPDPTAEPAPPWWRRWWAWAVIAL